MDNFIGFAGVLGSVLVGSVLSQVPTVSGWENMSAIAILGMTMYILLTRQNDKLERISQALVELKLEIKRLKRIQTEDTEE